MGVEQLYAAQTTVTLVNSQVNTITVKKFLEISNFVRKPLCEICAGNQNKRHCGTLCSAR